MQQLRSQAQPEMLEISSLMAGIVKDLQPYCRQIDLEIVMQPPDLPLHIYADRAMFRQALMNLLTKGFSRLRLKVITIEFAQISGQIQW